MTTREAQIFIAVLGASSYTYAEPSWDQTLESWIGAHVSTFEFVRAPPRPLRSPDLRERKPLRQGARFEESRTLSDFDFTYNSKIPAPLIRDLSTCGYLERKESVLLYGPVGVGKSHIA